MEIGYKIQIKGKNLMFLMASYNNKEKKCLFPRAYSRNLRDTIERIVSNRP